jgi:hypothetical protein
MTYAVWTILGNGQVPQRVSRLWDDRPLEVTPHRGYIGSDLRALRATFFTFFTARLTAFLARPTVDDLALFAITLS